MAHSLILGISEHGKTTLAKSLLARYRAAGIKSIVLDPMFDHWGADYQTHDVDQFLRVFWSSRSCAVFVDESGDAIGRFDTAMIRTATRGRHWGHQCHYLTQRGAQLSMTVRSQCSRLFMFAMAYDDAKSYAREWNKPALVQASQFVPGEYFFCGKSGPLYRGNIFEETSQ